MHPAEQKKRHLVRSAAAFCKNCGEKLKTDFQYCPKCGAKRIENRLTYKQVAYEFTERYFNIENTFLRTFIAMFTRPDDVIDGYITGVRKKYVAAFNYFAISLALGGIYVFLYQHFFSEDYAAWFGSFTDGGLDGRTQSSFDLSNKVQDFQGLLTFLLLPIMAVVSRLTFLKNKKYNYIEHLIIFFYTYSHINLISSVLYIFSMFSPVAFMAASTLSILFQFIYIPYTFKKLYQLNAENTILKTLLAWGISAIFVIVLSTAAMFIAYKLGLLDEVIEETRKAAAAAAAK